MITHSFKQIKPFKTMAVLISLLLSLGIISSPDQATPELIEQHTVVVIDTDVM